MSVIAEWIAAQTATEMDFPGSEHSFVSGSAANRPIQVTYRKCSAADVLGSAVAKHRLPAQILARLWLKTSLSAMPPACALDSPTNADSQRRPSCTASLRTCNYWGDVFAGTGL